MNGRKLVTFSALALIGLGCEGHQLPTATSVPLDPSQIISDGAHGGNPDFFFLPPMVPFPSHNPDFELGKFNNTLKPSLKIEICQLKSENLDAQGLPTATTGCVAGAPIKTFAPGTVQVVNLPLRQFGWWSLFGLPADGFYYVLWDTRQSNLNVNKFYRIKVLLNGSPTPLGIADVDPIKNLRQWKYSATGDVIQLIDDVLLPIPFRVEHGGGPSLCGDGALCNSVTVSNNSPTGSTIVTVDGGGGAIAGAKFPNGWLPAGGPQSVVVTVSQVNTGKIDPLTGAETVPCHVGLPLLQFPGCFRFTTTPTLAPINESGDQFAVPVTVAVCYTLQGSGDPREKFAEMWASGPNEPPHALVDVSDVGILAANTRNCSNGIIGFNEPKGVTALASTGWRKLKGGLNRLFGVKTAYAVDLGLGGIGKKFSNIGPALSATLVPYTALERTADASSVITTVVRVVGSNHHDGQHQNTVGLAGIPVTFTISEGNGGLRLPGNPQAPPSNQVTAPTADSINSLPGAQGGAAVSWTLPATAGTYTLTVNGPAIGGPITYTTTVPDVIGFHFLPGSLAAGARHTCGLTSGGAAYCWGENIYGQLGGVAEYFSLRPLAVTGGIAFASLAGGDSHTCGLTAAGVAYCWGFNQAGQLGDNSTTDRRTPTAVVGGISFGSLTGGFVHTCGLSSGGATYCWGENPRGELGIGTFDSNRTVPVAVVGGLTFTSLSVGGNGDHTCGVTSAGAAYCWGENDVGQLGIGTTIDHASPVAVIGEHSFASLTGAGDFHVCGLTAAGTAYCWGQNLNGQLGDGSTTPRTAPVPVTGELTFVSLAGGAFHTCGLTGRGAAYCWGANTDGQLGDGTTTDRSTPVAVLGGISFASLTAGESHTCGLTSEGLAYCWGTNGFGELGDGTSTNRTTPGAVANP